MTPRLLALLSFALCATSYLVAENFPKPEPEKTFPEFKIYSADGKPYRYPIEDWAGARKRVADDAAWKTWVQEKKDLVDAWMKRHHDRVEWVAGWSHDGVSPKDGSRLRWTEEIPGEEVQFFSSRTDPHVTITPTLFGWWVVSFRVRHSEMIQEAALLYRLTGDETYANWVASQLDFYAQNYLSWQPGRDGARLFWQTLTEATGLIRYTEAARNLGDFVTPERKKAWGEKFFYPEVAVLNASYRNVHNIACWQRGAAAQVALLYNDEALWREAVDGRWGIRTQLTEGVTSDYLWHEQSLGYNGFVVRALYSTFVAAAVRGRGPEFDREMAIAENLLLAPTYYRFPTGQLPNPADNTGLGFAPNRYGFAGVYRMFPTALGLSAAANRHDWETLLDPPPPAPAAVPLPEVKTRNLESSRMAILKTANWQLYFQYGQLTRSHTESEALNYAVFFGDTDITHDAGTAPYGSALHLGYFTRGLAHNVPLVNGEGEDLGPIGERREWIVEEPNPHRPMSGQLLDFSAVPARVSAAQPEYRKDASAQRTLTIEGDALVDRATIEAKGVSPQKLGLALHLQGEIRLPDTMTADSHFAAGRPEPFSYWENVRTGTYHDRAEFLVDYGTVVMRVTLAVPGEFKIWQGSSPDVPPQRRQSLYVETTGTKATFVTTYTPTTEKGTAAIHQARPRERREDD
jgi:hypothetical protein